MPMVSSARQSQISILHDPKPSGTANFDRFRVSLGPGNSIVIPRLKTPEDTQLANSIQKKRRLTEITVG